MKVGLVLVCCGFVYWFGFVYWVVLFIGLFCLLGCSNVYVFRCQPHF